MGSRIAGNPAACSATIQFELLAWEGDPKLYYTGNK